VIYFFSITILQSKLLFVICEISIKSAQIYRSLILHRLHLIAEILYIVGKSANYVVSAQIVDVQP